MNKTLWILLSAIAATVILLIVNQNRGMTLGLTNDKFASLASLTLVGVYIGLNALRPGAFGGHGLRNAAIWLFMFVALLTGYQYREPLQDIASTVTAGLVPARPQLKQGANGQDIVTIGKSSNGHFEVNAQVNTASTLFLVDTGATSIVLTKDDAVAIGIDVAALSYIVPVSTANGQAMAAPARIDEIIIGTITRRNMRALVAQEGALDQSLLGMDYLNTLSSFTIQKDELQLLD